MSSISPNTFEEAAAALAAAAAEGHTVGIAGGGSKRGWGVPAPDPQLELRTTALKATVEHNVGDLTAVFQAGVPLARAQQELAAQGQMLALDPPSGLPSRLPSARPPASPEGAAPESSGWRGSNGAATLGGVFATGDCGPLRHRYGAPRDLILGITVALSDGTIARAGGKVIKNVAGYDLAKLFTGSFGTLGVILSVSVRLHPLPVGRTTALGASADPDAVSSAAHALASEPLELEALDVAWRSGRGGILAQLAGVQASRRASRVAELMRTAGLTQVEVVTDDRALWARQRAGQRSPHGALVRIAARPSELASVLRAADACSGTLVGRAALGASFVDIDPGAVARLRAALPTGAVSVVLDAPTELRQALDPWGAAEGPALELMRRVKFRFDPAGACNPGVFVGGI